MKTVEIGGKLVGSGHPTFIIAEAGSNHDNDLDQAIRLIDVAADAGCDAVKFQIFRAEEMAARTSDPVATLNSFGRTETLFELYKRLEIPRGWLATLQAHAAKRGILIFATPFDRAAVDLMVELGMPAIKMASFELPDLPLLKYCARTGLPIIISTGIAGLGEVEEAVRAMEEEGNGKIIILHCNSAYPTEFADVHLRSMETLRQAFGYPVGYSDHTLGITVPIAVATLGGNVIEKHFTVDNTLPGPDHKFALPPAQLRAMVDGMRAAEAALGSSHKVVTASSSVTKKIAGRSMFAARDLEPGHVITTEDIVILRPGTGLHPRFLPVILGRSVKKAVASNEPIDWDALL